MIIALIYYYFPVGILMQINKCIALNCCEYKKVLTLIPNNNNNIAIHFYYQINEDKQNEDANNVHPTNDTKSVINRLSKLGLKIRNSKLKDYIIVKFMIRN